MAYRRFKQATWKTQSLLELGVVGIDDKVEKGYGDLLKKFEDVKGVPGPKPKNYKPAIKSKLTDGGGMEMQLDPRSAALIKKAIEADKKRHDDLRYFLYSNIYASVWAAFETYSQMLFEELLKKKPEMLKSKEQILIENVISNREHIVEYLVERQVESIGHFKITELLEYLKAKLNFAPSTQTAKKLKDYYFIRNVIAHKSGIVRESQVNKLPQGVKCIEDELQISEAFLKSMIKNIEAVVTAIERNVDEKFYKKA